MKPISAIDDLQPDARNANKGTERGAYMIRRSLQEVGAGRSIVTDAEGRVVAGNKTLEAAEELGLPIRVVQTDGKELVVVQRTDLDLSDPHGLARRYAYWDNRTGQVDLDWAEDVIAADVLGGLDLSAMFTDAELGIALDLGGEPVIDDGETELPTLERADVPDATFPTDNDWGVPVLDLSMAARSLDNPVVKWGVTGRKNRMRGTFHFYTDDYKFNALWADPTPVINSGCASAVEPNFSTGDQMPKAAALWGVFRKRWLARYWQSYGVRVFVDLNVWPHLADINMLGVPQGWNAYATRWLDKFGVGDVEAQWRMAQERAGMAAPLFVVFGGRAAAERACMDHGWVWVREHAAEVNDGQK